MKSKIFQKIVIVFIFTHFTAVDYAQNTILQGSPFIKNYTPNDINGGPQIWSWAEDKRGMVYFGDPSGIIEFNGREWRRINNTNNTIVREMAVDSLGRIYVGASDDFGFLQPNDKGEMEYISLSKSVSNKGIKFLDIWGIYSTSHGVYFCSNKYVFRYFRKKISIIPVDFLVQDAYLLNDQLYLPTPKGLCLLHDVNLVLKSTKIRFHLTPWDGDELISTNGVDELCIFNIKTSEIKEFKTRAKAFFKANLISSLERIDKNRYVITTKTNKIVILSDNGDVLQVIDKNSGLLSSNIYKIYVDKDKNLWICTSKGISKIDINFPILSFGEKNNINTNVIESCFFNNKRYIATIDGIYFLPPFDLNKSDESQKFIKVKPIYDESWEFMEMNSQLFSLCSMGIWVINNDRAKLIYEIPSPQKAHCFSANPLFPNVIFVGMRGKLVALTLNRHKDINKIKVIDEINFPEITEKIRKITCDKNGNLWLNTQFNGVYFLRFIDGNLKNYRLTLLGKKNGLPNLDYTKTYNVNNEIIISTQFGFLQPKFPDGKNNSDSLIRFKQCMLFGDSIKDPYPIISHVFNNKYLIAGIGLQYVSIGGTNQTFDTCGFNRLSFCIESFSVGVDSIISFCSPDGLFNYNIKNRRNFKKTFNVVISRVVTNNDSILFSGTFYKWKDSIKLASFVQNSNLIPTLEYRNNSLTFYYSGLFYEDSERTEFQHQLVGFDKEWSDWASENKSTYTNLSEGKYIFKVRARNVYGVISSVADYQFIISAPWYRSWWASVIYFLLFVAVIYITVKLYTRRLSKRNESLEMIVKERTAEIIKQAKELKTTNEKLIEMDKFKQGITSMIVHDLKNPINAIINIPDTEIVSQIDRVKQTGRQMLNLVMNILDVNKYEETKILLNTEKVLLLDISRKVVESILFLSEDKNISISNRIKNNLIVEADVEMIERVFMNILTNAIKYTPNNGRIIIDAELIYNHQEASYVKVSIADNGMGIDADKIDLVFEKFGQIVAKNSGSVRSTGLGLTYCKMVINAHEGEINVVSEKQKGSTFWFTLPGYTDDKIILEKTINETYEMTIYELSLESQQLIMKSLLELQSSEIYKISELYLIIEKIDDSLNNEIHGWKKLLITAIDSGNELLFKKLIFTDTKNSDTI